jgi:hypothetical protein
LLHHSGVRNDISRGIKVFGEGVVWEGAADFDVPGDAIFDAGDDDATREPDFFIVIIKTPEAGPIIDVVGGIAEAEDVPCLGLEASPGEEVSTSAGADFGMEELVSGVGDEGFGAGAPDGGEGIGDALLPAGIPGDGLSRPVPVL